MPAANKLLVWRQAGLSLGLTVQSEILQSQLRQAINSIFFQFINGTSIFFRVFQPTMS